MPFQYRRVEHNGDLPFDFSDIVVVADPPADAEEQEQEQKQEQEQEQEILSQDSRSRQPSSSAASRPVARSNGVIWPTPQAVARSNGVRM